MTRTRLATIALIGMALMSRASFAAHLPPGTADAWVDDRLVTVQVAGTFADPVAGATTHILFTSTVTLPGRAGDVFLPVLETPPGADHASTTWAEVDITFRFGLAPRQLTSAADVMHAMAAGEILVRPTGTRYVLTLLIGQAGDTPGRRKVPAGLLKPSAAGSQAVTWGYLKARGN